MKKYYVQKLSLINSYLQRVLYDKTSKLYFFLQIVLECDIVCEHFYKYYKNKIFHLKWKQTRGLDKGTEGL